MQKFCKPIRVIAIVVITVFIMIACSGNRIINSTDELKKYLDNQPTNSLDKPIKVNINVNDLMIKNIVNVVNSAGKYVYLDFSKSAGLTTLAEGSFHDCKALVGITLPNSVTSIGRNPFHGCTNLNNFIVVGVDTSLNGAWFLNSNGIKSGTKFVFNNGKLTIYDYDDYIDESYYIAQDGNYTEIDDNSPTTNNYSVNHNTLTIGGILFTKQ